MHQIPFLVVHALGQTLFALLYEEYYSSVDAEPFDWYGTWDTKITWEDSGDTSPLSSVRRWVCIEHSSSIIMKWCI